MKKLILATIAVAGFSGAALAQEAPALIYGDAYEQNVQNVSEGFGVDFTGTASVGPTYDNASTVTFDNGSAATLGNINANENYSGR